LQLDPAATDDAKAAAARAEVRDGTAHEQPILARGAKQANVYSVKTVARIR
jgi:hypothetical protein